MPLFPVEIPCGWGEARDWFPRPSSAPVRWSDKTQSIPDLALSVIQRQPPGACPRFTFQLFYGWEMRFVCTEYMQFCLRWLQVRVHSLSVLSPIHDPSSSMLNPVPYSWLRWSVNGPELTPGVKAVTTEVFLLLSQFKRISLFDDSIGNYPWQ